MYGSRTCNSSTWTWDRSSICGRRRKVEQVVRGESLGQIEKKCKEVRLKYACKDRNLMEENMEIVKKETKEGLDGMVEKIGRLGEALGGVGKTLIELAMGLGKMAAEEDRKKSKKV